MIRAVVTLLLVGAAALGALRFANALATVDVQTVRVFGDLSHAEGLEVRDAVADTLARPGVIGVDDVARSVESLGWVGDVEVREQWPDVLHVRVARQTLAARWGDDGESYLTTGGNVVPVPPDERDPVLRELPVLKASHATSAEAMRLNTVLDDLALAANLRLDRLQQDEAGNWIAVASPRETSPSVGVEVVLGNRALRERFRRFLAVHDAVLKSRIEDVAQVDARYETGVAVRWKEQTEEPGEQPVGTV